MKSELADRDFAFANAQETIAGLEKEVEELQDGVQHEEAEKEMCRLMQVSYARLGQPCTPSEKQLDPIPQSSQQNFGNAQLFNMDSGDKPEAPSASSSSKPKPTKFFYPTIQPKDAKPGAGQPDAQAVPEAYAKPVLSD